MYITKFLHTFLLFAVCTGINDAKLADIINGRNARNDRERPYQISLQIRKKGTILNFCGGSIINQYYIATAAHCTNGHNASLFHVGAGSINYKKPKQLRKTVKIIQHQGFTLAERHDDISLIKVDRPFRFGRKLKPVKLPKPHEKFQPGSKAILSGWGREKESQKPLDVPRKLQVVDLYTLSQEDCIKAYEDTKNPIYSTNICALGGSKRERRGQCNGDSGGPLTVNGKLAGIVSWSIKDPDCGSTTKPGVFTRVSEYIDWIQEGLKS